MKLILTAEVDHLGTSGDIVEVKDGYGRNFLLPRGLAVVASRGAERQAEEIRRAREAKSVQGLEHANELKTALEGLGGVELSVKAAGGHRQAVRFGDGAPTWSRPSRRPAARIWTSAPSSCPRRTSSRSAPTRSRCGCTRRWTPRCR